MQRASTFASFLAILLITASSVDARDLLKEKKVDKDAELAEVAKQFDIWNDALQTLDPKKVASLYAPGGVLLPTVSNQVRNTPAEIEDYFKYFLTLKPRGTIDESNVRILSPNSAINSGIYTFDIERDGNPAKVQARYSFTYKKVDGKWMIADHHSSAMPEPVNAPKVEQIAKLFDAWNAALATLNPEKVADMYAPDGVLLPTVSNNVRSSRAEIVDYFVSFLKKKPQGKIDESNIRLLDDNTAINAGIYTFDLLGDDGKPTKVQARYSYTYKNYNGTWLIADHQSSVMPETPEKILSDVGKLFDKWNAALATLEPKTVAALYAPDGILLPTVSNDVRTNRDEIEAYFEDFLKLKPQGKIDESHVRMLAPDVAMNSGVYTFDTVNGKVQARYTFTYKRIGARWLISDHHSSAMPEKTA